jgi:hypothetical protein
MKILRYSTLSLALLFLIPTTNAQEIRWYPFDKDFVSHQYSNSAIGELRVKKFRAAKTIHSESCGGKDAELHIGVKKSDLDLQAASCPLLTLLGQIQSGESLPSCRTQEAERAKTN